LGEWICSGTVNIELVHGAVIPRNSGLMNKLKQRNARSNVLDYISVKPFHEMAAAISGQDCVHFGYSMNWKRAVCGVFVIDYPYHQFVLQLSMLLGLLERSFGKKVGWTRCCEFQQWTMS